jgi:hypothetical protein
VGAGFGLGLIAAALLAVVAALRPGAASFVWVWLAAWGVIALVLGPLGALVRRARPLPLAAWCVPVGLLLALAPLALFGRVLKAATHHRPLGAATFAVVAVVLVVGAIAYSARVISELSARRGGEDFRPVRALSVAAAGVMVLVGIGVAIRALGGDAGLQRLAVDGVLLFSAVAVVGWAPVPSPAAERGRGAVLALWVVAVLAGVVALRRPEVAEVIAVVSPLIRLLPLPVS